MFCNPKCNLCQREGETEEVAIDGVDQSTGDYATSSGRELLRKPATTHDDSGKVMVQQLQGIQSPRENHKLEAAATLRNSSPSSRRPPPVFDVDLNWERLGVKSLGLDVSTTFPRYLVVERVRDQGAIWAWNRKNPDHWVGPGDRLLKVGDAEGDPRAMVDKAKLLVLQQTPVLLRVEKKPQEFTVKLSFATPENVRPLGVTVNPSKVKDAVLVEDVKTEGMVAVWNKENHEIGWVAPGDTIVEVNSERTNPDEMLEQLKDAQNTGKGLEFVVKSRTELALVWE